MQIGLNLLVVLRVLQVQWFVENNLFWQSSCFFICLGGLFRNNLSEGDCFETRFGFDRLFGAQVLRKVCQRFLTTSKGLLMNGRR